MSHRWADVACRATAAFNSDRTKLFDERPTRVFHTVDRVGDNLDMAREAPPRRRERYHEHRRWAESQEGIGATVTL